MFSKRAIKYWLIFAAVFFTVSAVAVIGNDSSGRESISWPSTTGKIIESGVEEVEDMTNEISSTEYQLYVKYRYKVEGKEYTSYRVRFTGMPSHTYRDDALLEKAKYPLNTEVKVYYDPDDPKTACLEPGGDSRLSTAVGVVMLLLLAGLCIVGVFVIR